MVRATARHLARLAGLAQDLERKRVLCAELQTLLNTAEGAGAAVEGEKWILKELQGQLDAAVQVLGDLRGVQDTQAAARQLDQLEELLSDVQWELTGQVRSDLQKKDQAQRQLVRNYEDQLAERQARIGELEEKLRQPFAARAPLVQEKLELRRMQGLYEQAQRALREQRYGDLAQSLEKLQPPIDGLSNLLKAVEDKTAQASRFAKQADLLLLQSPLDAHQRYQYTVLLRTPSEPGSHGINIQGSSTLVKQDRELMGRQIDDITRSIDAGLARQFALRSGQPATTEATPTAGEARADAESAEEAEVARDLILGRPVGGAAAEDVSLVVQNAGELMYSLFMPEQMQTYLSEKPCALTITTNDLELPWELMCYEGRFLCLDRPVARMPMGRAFPREEPRASRSGGRLRFLLIYADPEGNLPAAWSQEILPIQQALQEQWKDQIDVQVLGREEALGTRLNDLLRSGEYDVIHYAGHAFFDKEDGDLSGLLLHKGEVFFAQKIRRLLRGRPLVFLNACQTGRTANEEQPQKVDYFLQGPAEGLASAFVYGGALGCIGSLWPIYDRPAAEFAIYFYNKVLEGYMIGEALRLARVEIRRLHPESITWAAFVLYGDPTIRLAD